MANKLESKEREEEKRKKKEHAENKKKERTRKGKTKTKTKNNNNNNKKNVTRENDHYLSFALTSIMFTNSLKARAILPGTQKVHP